MADALQLPEADRAGVFAGRLTWPDWQRAVLARLHTQCPDVLQHVRIEDVDWASWENLFTRGFTPRSAVDCVLERDF